MHKLNREKDSLLLKKEAKTFCYASHCGLLSLHKIGSLKKSFLLLLRSKERAVAILSSDDFEITTSFCFRKTSRDDMEI